MVDRILHISHKFAGEYDKELLQRAAEIYIYKGPSAVVPHLVNIEKRTTPDAEVLAGKIHAEMRKVNRQVLLQYGVVLLVFTTVAVFSLTSRSYIFAALFIVPALLLFYSLLKFLRRNNLR